MAPQSLTAVTGPEPGLMLESSTNRTRKARDTLASTDTHLNIPPNSCQQRRERFVPITLQLSP